MCWDAVNVDLVEDFLWVRMELMERSLADIISLVGEGLMLQDGMIARFASNVWGQNKIVWKPDIVIFQVQSF